MNEDKKTKYKIIGIYRVRLIISYFSCLLFINKFYLNIFFLNKIPILFSDCIIPINCFKNSFQHMQRVKYLEDIVFDKHYCNKTLIQVRLNLLKHNGQCAYLGC